jgi:uncharacterized protein (TIGR00369 family)
MAESPPWLTRLRESGNLEGLLAAIPYVHTTLGLTASLREGELLIKMAGREQLIGNPMLPALHGGTVGAMLESTAILTLLRESETTGVPKTITLTIDYLRSARVVDTWACATITRQGRRVANVQARAWQDDERKPIAVAHAHFLLQSGET